MKEILSILGFIGFVMFASGIFLQNSKIIKSREIKDISVGEVRFRTAASVLSTIGVCISGSWLLIAGVIINCLAMLRYCWWIHRLNKCGGDTI